MTVFDRFLSLLDRPNVAELCLCTGSNAAVRVGDQLHPVTQRPLRNQDILAIVAGTSLEAAIRDQAGDFTRVVEHAARQLRITVRRAAGSLQIYVSLAGADATGEQPIPIELGSRDSTGDEPSTSDDSFAHSVNQEEPAEAPQDFLTAVLLQARRDATSDVHFMSGEPVRCRRVGELKAMGRPVPHEQLETELQPLLNDARRASLKERGYVDFSFDHELAGRLRVNLCRQRTGIKACVRLIPSKPPTLAELGLPPELAKAQEYHQGLIVISGPNGHGKTTTLAALVDLFNQSRPAHIITVEDPVEFLHPPKRSVVSQREVGSHTISFQTALKAALREDPDIIAIGELRDRETVEMALTASETGHIVLATMSTPNGSSTIERLIDMFAPEDQSQVRATLAGALKLVISQRLVPTSDRGRFVPAAELITGNVPLWTLIRENKLYQLPSLLQRGRGYGMIRVEDSLNELVDKGLVDIDVARAYADEPKNVGTSPKAAVPAAPPLASGGPGVMGMFRKKG